jgi:hypothetical protein
VLAKYYSNSIREVPDSNIRVFGGFFKVFEYYSRIFVPKYVVVLVLYIELNKAIPNSPPYLGLFQYHYRLHLHLLLRPPSLVDIVVF